MIAYLKGRVLEKTLGYLIVENFGIGYKVFTIPEMMEKRIGDEIEFYTYMKVSDDGQSLYGLPSFASLQFFELLLTVSGVGPKSALSIMSAANVPTLESAIAGQDSAMFTRMSGVGKKTAERIILELKSKVGTLNASGTNTTSEVYDALIALGYTAREAASASSNIPTGLSTKEQIKHALQYLRK